MGIQGEKLCELPNDEIITDKGNIRSTIGHLVYVRITGIGIAMIGLTYI